MTESRPAVRFDVLLLLPVLALVGLGLVMVYSASAITAQEKLADSLPQGYWNSTRLSYGKIRTNVSKSVRRMFPFKVNDIQRPASNMQVMRLSGQRFDVECWTLNVGRSSLRSLARSKRLD